MKKHIKNNCVLDRMAKVLPVFRGYTVDVRLGQFRKSDPAKQEIEFMVTHQLRMMVPFILDHRGIVFSMHFIRMAH